MWEGRSGSRLTDPLISGQTCTTVDHLWHLLQRLPEEENRSRGGEKGEMERGKRRGIALQVRRTHLSPGGSGEWREEMLLISNWCEITIWPSPGHGGVRYMGWCFADKRNSLGEANTIFEGESEGTKLKECSYFQSWTCRAGSTMFKCSEMALFPLLHNHV